MTIGDKLTYLSETKDLIKQAIINKGVEVSDTDTFRSYAAAIDNIESGTAINNQDKEITSNGTYTADEGYTGLGTVTVNVEGGSFEFIGIPRKITSDGYFLIPDDFNFSLPSSVTTIGMHSLNHAFIDSWVLSVSLPSVTTIDEYGMYEAFKNCSELSSVDFSNITTVRAYGMYGVLQSSQTLKSVNLSSLTTVGEYGLAYAFKQSTGLTSVDLSSLTTISGSSAMNSAFDGCPSLTSVDLSSLTNINGSGVMTAAFTTCARLTNLSFPALTSTSFGSYTNQFNRMLYKVKGCTVHFPSNLQSVIGEWEDVTAGFGGTNTIVLFDLPATT